MSIDKDTTIPEEKEFIDWTERLTETVNKKKMITLLVRLKAIFYRKSQLMILMGVLKMTIGSF